MTTQEAADKWGVTKSTVKKWCRYDLIPGVYKVKMHRGMTWILPDDAVPPPPGTGRKRGGQNSDSSAKPKRGMTNERYIMLNGATQSTRWIAQVLGISTAEVRAIYDKVYMKINNQ